MQGIEKSLEELIAETNSLSNGTPKSEKDPLSQIVKILDSQLSSLQWIDQKSTELQEKVDKAKQVGTKVQQDLPRASTFY